MKEFFRKFGEFERSAKDFIRSNHSNVDQAVDFLDGLEDMHSELCELFDTLAYPNGHGSENNYKPTW